VENVQVVYSGQGSQYQNLSPEDLQLINTSTIDAVFGRPGDYVEYFVKDLDGSVLEAVYNDIQYSIGSVVDPQTGTTNQLIINPERDAKATGVDRGTFAVKYNFLTTQLASNFVSTFWIKEISVSRTEIKAARQDLSNSELLDAFGTFNGLVTADAYFPVYYLNFGADQLVLATNAAYLEEGGVGYIVFKLYEPLPDDFQLKSTFWVVTEVAESAEYTVTIQVTPEDIPDTATIRGPNFKVGITDRIGQTTPYFNYTNLYASNITSSIQQIASLTKERALQINVDYSNFENFIHFSSATQRLYNFVYKLQQIESASYGLSQNNTVSARIALQKQIDNTITNFDPWEYYLYFNSGSTSWPKQTDRTPFALYSVTSSQAVNWLGSPVTDPSPGVISMYWSSSYYDDQNKDWLINSTPQYLLDDDQNAPYFSFLNMIGQHFDNIWIYLRDVTNHYNANNNPFVGISMDQVSEALESFGIKLYTNTSVTDNLYYTMFGINQTGSLLPVTSSLYSTVVFSSSSLYPPASSSFLSASLFLPPFGQEKINRYVVTMPYAINNLLGVWNAPNSIYNISVWGGGSISRGFVTPSLPGIQLQDEIYKRIYHNLPYLVKTRGTERGLRALIAIYGVPTNVLEPFEFGGYNYLEYPGIQEISQVRIITGSVQQVSSSLLSPYTTLQFYNNDIQKTSITVQAGFSPADSINASITSSGYVTSSTQPGYFNIMQYIGAPNLQYSSSYIPLGELSETYFTNEYTDRYNVWDFIRLIKYYNNSLFKMMRDWVPARASADTGIVIKSHMLERSKYPRHEPTYTTSSYDADYYLLVLSGSDGGSVIDNTNFVAGIPIQYNGTASIALTASIGTVFMSSSNDIQKYTGEFSGSYINVVTDYFPQEEISSYIYPWTSSVPGNGPLFLTYSVSPLFENVFTPVRSQRFLDLDFNTSQLAPVNYGLITKSLEDTVLYGNITQSLQPYSQYAFVQDYNYNFRPSIIPRYSGSYLSGQYNVSVPGDISYGDDPVIDYYTDKLGLFVQVATSSFFPGKVNAALAYLADVSGGLFELNQNNRNWVDVQNIFVAGTSATIKQFDNRKYGNQVSTDGVKSIYSSGYNYTPQIYFTSGLDNTLFFTPIGAPGLTFLATNSGSNAFISGTLSPSFPVRLTIPVIRQGFIYDIFNTANPSTGYRTGSTALGVSPSYTASIGEIKNFTVKLGINYQFPDPEFNPAASGSYTFSITQAGSAITSSQQSIFVNSSYTASSPATASLNTFAPVSVTFPNYTVLSSNIGPSYGPWNVTSSGVPTATNVGTPSDVLYYDIVQLPGGGIYNLVKTGGVPASLSGYIGTYPGTFATPINITPGTAIPSSKTFSGSRDISFTFGPVNLAPSDTVTFALRQNEMSTSNFTCSLSTATLTGETVSVGQGGYVYATTTGSFIDGIVNTTDVQSQIILSRNLTSYLGYEFVPYFISASLTYSSSLYNQYGDVNVAFYPQSGDKILLSDFNGITQDFDVISTDISGSRAFINVSPNALTNWTLNPKLILKVLILRRYDDEQNVILTFNKNPGPTSYGFLIPDTINPTVVQNINTLQAAVQSQLLNGQSPLPQGI
jgi:hypothetical protein